MLKAIAIALVVVIAAVLGFAATKPDAFRIQRSITIQAPPEKVFKLITDFQQWKLWSPWEGRDPAMKRVYAGPPSGKGATYQWEGNNEVGSGRMEIVEAAAPSKIMILLDFFKPFEAHNITEFTLRPDGNATEVTWAMHGPANYMTKLIHVFISMDAMVGKDFEAGLANMKAAAEKP